MCFYIFFYVVGRIQNILATKEYLKFISRKYQKICRFKYDSHGRVINLSRQKCSINFFGLVGRVFANDPVYPGSISDQIIRKTQKCHLILLYLALSIIRYGSRVKWNNPGKGVVPFPTPRCISRGKVSLQVTLDYGQELYFLYFKHRNRPRFLSSSITLL